MPSLKDKEYLDAMTNKVLVCVKNSVEKYLLDPSSNTYSTMIEDISGVLNDTNFKNIPGKRIVIGNADHWLVYDSSKTNNTHANALLKSTINSENHASRKCFMEATLNNSGIAYQIKLSGTTGATESRCTVRMGDPFTAGFLGTTSVSCTVSPFTI